MVALVGAGQEIHEGEEAGIGQWQDAVLHATQPEGWVVHVAPHLQSSFDKLDARPSPDLHLTAELRFHLASEVHRLVEGILGESDDADLAEVAHHLEGSGYHLRITRDLRVAKRYLKERYKEDPDARFGLLASSRDKDLIRFGVPNDWNSTKVVKHGPWFGEGDDDPSGRSCRALRDCVTEFGCQGLELDAVLLAWGTDLICDGDQWSNQRAKRYQKPWVIRDALQLRRNAYRVLLTRSRDATVVFVPPLPVLDETFKYLVDSGFREIQ